MALLCDIYVFLNLKLMCSLLCRNLTRKIFRTLVLFVTVCLLLPVYRHLQVLERLSSENFEHVGCQLRDIYPWNPEMVRESHKLQCPSEGPLFIVNDTGHLVLLPKQLTRLAMSIQDLNCFYHSINRDTDSNIKVGDPISFRPPVFIDHRVFKVNCLDPSKKITYRWVHFNVMSDAGSKRMNQTEEADERLKEAGKERPSIIIIGLDSMSRAKAVRSMPITMNYLTGALNAYDFKGYTKVGENTLPNLIPLLTGLRNFDNSNGGVLNDYFDELPLFWKDREEYVSLFCEDETEFDTFNYQRNGFLKEPADFYCRSLIQAMEMEQPIFNRNLQTKHCYGNKLTFEIQLDYLKKYLTKYKQKKRIAFLWNNDLGHDNYTIAENIDVPLFVFLTWLKKNGHLDQSVVMLVSDHGYRIGDPGFSYEGQLEGANPLFVMHVPTTMKIKDRNLHSNLLFNTDKLITPFDVHTTLVNILDKNHHTETIGPQVGKFHQKRDIFQQIPLYRTCEDAGVPFEFCERCFNFRPVDPRLQHVVKMANFAVSKINEFLQNQSYCQKLKLNEIKSAKVTLNKIYTEAYESTYFQGINGRYKVVFVTSPNNGLYDVMIDLIGGDVETTGFTLQLLGVPHKLNRYGNRSACVSTSFLKPFCFCV